MRIFCGALIGAVATLLSTAVSALTVTGAGATFPYPIYAMWSSAYKGETGVAINYEAVGSGLGISLIRSKTVTFGASDMPLKPQLLEQFGLIQFPTVVGGDVPVVNLPGVRPGQLVLDGPTLAGIYLGKITRWDDPAIRKLNPGTNLPALAIAVFHRSDGSGTTFIWADYLSKVSADWGKNIGANTTVDWPIGTGANGNEGVSRDVAETNGAIGYVEFSYALKHGLAFAKAINRDGKVVSPSLESFRAVADKADWASAPNFYLLLTNQPGEDTWPMTGATFILIPKQPSDPAATNAALKFFQWAYEKGGDSAIKLNYVPLPASATQLIEESWKQVSLKR